MFTSLRSRLWLSYFFVVVVALGIVATVLFLYLLRSPLLYREASSKLQVVQTLLDRRQVNEWIGQNPATLKQRIDQADENFDVRILVFDVDRSLLADSRASEAPLGLPRLLAARNFALERDTQGRQWVYTLRKLSDKRWLMLAVPRPRLAVWTVLRDDLFSPLIAAGLVGLILALLMAYAISRWVADPLQQVITVSHRMPDQEAHPLPLRGPREVQELVRSFNAMSVRVQQSQRSQREFVANVSHELKTPLTSIQGFAQAILDGTADSPEARQRSAQVIYTESGRMHRMVLDLLDLARLDSGMLQMKREDIDLDILLRGMLEKFKPQAHSLEIDLIYTAAEPLPSVTGDGDRLAQVFTNLIDNALKFTPRGGMVRLEVGVLGDQVQVSVSDNGAGIPSEKVEHIFERFYQADAARPGGVMHGAGLGLSIVREIVQAHGGKISVRSMPGQGSTFTVSLPLAWSDTPAPANRKK